MAFVLHARLTRQASSDALSTRMCALHAKLNAARNDPAPLLPHHLLALTSLMTVVCIRARVVVGMMNDSRVIHSLKKAFFKTIKLLTLLNC